MSFFKFIYLFIFCFCQIAIVSVGSEVESGNSRIFVTYFPYDFGLLRDHVTPVPDYQGWPIDRVEKDFMRFAEMGVDGVLVGVPIDGLLNTTRPDRYERLLTSLTEHKEWPKIAFFVYVHDELTSESEEFFKKWIVDTLSRRPEKYMMLDGRPLVVFGPRLKWRFRHPALTVRLSAPEFGEWPIDNSNPMRGLQQDFEALWISPVPIDLVVTSERTLMRNRNAFDFEDKLREVLDAGTADHIILYSWNDYRGGTFIEPNSMDEYDMSRAVYRALHR